LQAKDIDERYRVELEHLKEAMEVWKISTCLFH
jgi:hypothetical protein